MVAKLYPELPYYANIDMVDSRQLYDDLIRYAAEMKFLLERVRTVVSVNEVGRPEEGFIVFATSVQKYKGYVSGTGWVDFH